MASIIASYSESNQDSSYAVGGSQVLRMGQSFQAIAATLDSVKFFIYRHGTITGNAVAKIYSQSASLPNAILATSDNVDVSTISTSFSLITFTFSGSQRINLINSSTYYAVFEFLGGDATNYMVFGVDSSSPPGPWGVYYITSWIQDNSAYCFYVYGIVKRRNFPLWI